MTQQDSIVTLATSAEKADYIPLVKYPGYEILNYEPFTIRKISNKKVVTESPHPRGYIQLYMNGKTCLKHRVIADQFVHNPDPVHNKVVDHKDRNKNNNHPSNLRHTTQSTNCKNRTSYRGIPYEYVDTTPDDIDIVEAYEGHEFDDIYYSKGVFYKDTGDNKLRVMRISVDINNGKTYICAFDINGIQININIKRWMNMHGYHEHIPLIKVTVKPATW